MNAPLALVTALITLGRMPESRNRHAPPKLDWRGTLLAACALAAIAFGLIQSSELGWRHPAVLAASALAVASALSAAGDPAHVLQDGDAAPGLVDYCRTRYRMDFPFALTVLATVISRLTPARIVLVAVRNGRIEAVWRLAARGRL